MILPFLLISNLLKIFLRCSSSSFYRKSLVSIKNTNYRRFPKNKYLNAGIRYTKWVVIYENLLRIIICVCFWPRRNEICLFFCFSHDCCSLLRDRLSTQLGFYRKSLILRENRFRVLESYGGFENDICFIFHWILILCPAEACNIYLAINYYPPFYFPLSS